MSQNVQKISKNPIEDVNSADDINDIDYYWNLKEDFCANSQSKTVKFRFEESTSSIGSVSSSDLLDNDDDASSNLSPQTRLLHEFSDSTTKSQLSTRKGLSRYYEGKAKTFSSLSDVKCAQDLAKKQIPFVKRGHRSRTYLQSPKTIIISKKNTRTSAS
ncbi:protein OXIDATIVE STRESS 3-like [Humulus lupulus]|uniref:protein OXIDATIVE STRESS 3-like n=1 Tax=Humulus lupulus TaxID=3486 RepID=UPI002B414BFD|nr:protein OXIDATIVE STRESS 3-like [Humulus lupulus]